jgi:hypothetical protein
VAYDLVTFLPRGTSDYVTLIAASAIVRIDFRSLPQGEPAVRHPLVRLTNKVVI